MDKLRKEVREALDVFAGEAVCMCHEAYTSRKMKDPDCNHHLYEYVETIRAELLRLAEENAENRWERGRYPGKITQHWLRAAFDRIAAGEPEVQVLDDYGYAPAKELAALRERIADAPVVEVTLGCQIDETIPCELALKRVLLVLDEEEGE